MLVKPLPGLPFKPHIWRPSCFGKLSSSKSDTLLVQGHPPLPLTPLADAGTQHLVGCEPLDNKFFWTGTLVFVQPGLPIAQCFMQTYSAVL